MPARLFDRMGTRRASLLLWLGAVVIAATFFIVGTSLSNKAPRSSVDANRAGIIASCETLNGVIKTSRNIRSKPAEDLFAIVLRLASPSERRQLQADLAEQKNNPDKTGLPTINCEREVEKAAQREQGK